MFCHSRAHPSTNAVAVAVLLVGFAAAFSPLAAQPVDDAGVIFEERFWIGERSEPVFTRPETQRILSSMPSWATADESVATAEAMAADAYPLAQLPAAGLAGPAKILGDVISEPAELAEAEPEAPLSHGEEGVAPAQAAEASAEAQTSQDVASVPLPDPELPPPPPPAEVVLTPEQPEASTATASVAPESSSETAGEPPATTSSVRASPSKPQVGSSKTPPARARISKRHAPEHGQQTVGGAKPRRNAAKAPASTEARLARDLKRELAKARRQMDAVTCRVGIGCVSSKQLVGTAAGAVAGGAAAGPGGAVAGGVAGAILTAPRAPRQTGTDR